RERRREDAETRVDVAALRHDAHAVRSELDPARRDAETQVVQAVRECGCELVVAAADAEGCLTEPRSAAALHRLAEEQQGQLVRLEGEAVRELVLDELPRRPADPQRVEEPRGRATVECRALGNRVERVERRCEGTDAAPELLDRSQRPAVE